MGARFHQGRYMEEILARLIKVRIAMRAGFQTEDITLAETRQLMAQCHDEIQAVTEMLRAALPANDNVTATVDEDRTI